MITFMTCLEYVHVHGIPFQEPETSLGHASLTNFVI